MYVRTHRALRATSRYCNLLLLWTGGIVLLGMMLLACANMLFRATWEPIKGSYELMGFFGALVAGFSLGNTQDHKGHIALTVLAGLFPKRVERAVDAITSLGCAVFFGLIAWRTGVWACSLIRTGELSETLHMPYYPFPFAVALGILALAVTLLCDALDALLAMKHPAPSAKEKA